MSVAEATRITRSPIGRAGLRSHAETIAFAIPLVLLVLIAILADVLPLPDPNAQRLDQAFLPPSLAETASGVHPLGTDQLGRDMFSRLVHGARLTLVISVTAMIAAIVPGTILGLCAGYFRGKTDLIISRFVDAQLAIPFVLLAIAMITSNGRSTTVLIVVLALFSWAPFARVVRAEALSLRERTFVLGLRAAGASDLRIVFRHILPNQQSTLFVLATLQLGSIILAESALSFLGLGVIEPEISWGSMLAGGRDYLVSAWWISTFPGLAILVTVLFVNLFGDSLRSLTDPKKRSFS